MRRTILAHRRLLAAGLAAGAVAVALPALAPAPPVTTPVLVAATDLPAGTVLRPADIDRRAMPPEAVPDGALTDLPDAAGRVLAGPARRGEPLTDVRLVGRPLLAGYGDGLVAAPVRLADAEAVALLRPGDVIDVLATETGLDGTAPTVAAARVLAAAAPVVTVPAPPSDELGGGAGEGALVVLATSRRVAAALARAAVTARLSFTIG